MEEFDQVQQHYLLFVIVFGHFILIILDLQLFLQHFLLFSNYGQLSSLMLLI
jgi:hypothetical protein